MSTLKSKNILFTVYYGARELLIKLESNKVFCKDQEKARDTKKNIPNTIFQTYLVKLGYSVIISFRENQNLSMKFLGKHEGDVFQKVGRTSS